MKPPKDCCSGDRRPGTRTQTRPQLHPSGHQRSVFLGQRRPNEPNGSIRRPGTETNVVSTTWFSFLANHSGILDHRIPLSFSCSNERNIKHDLIYPRSFMAMVLTPTGRPPPFALFIKNHTHSRYLAVMIKFSISFSLSGNESIIFTFQYFSKDGTFRFPHATRRHPFSHIVHKHKLLNGTPVGLFLPPRRTGQGGAPSVDVGDGVDPDSPGFAPLRSPTIRFWHQAANAPVGGAVIDGWDDFPGAVVSSIPPRTSPVGRMTWNGRRTPLRLQGSDRSPPRRCAPWPAPRWRCFSPDICTSSLSP